MQIGNVHDFLLFRRLGCLGCCIDEKWLLLEMKHEQYKLK